MRRALSYVVFLDLLFILFLAASASFTGVLGELIYYLAFLLPILIGVLLIYKKSDESHPLSLKLGRQDIIFTAILTAPTLALVFLLSFVTFLILGLFFEPTEQDSSGNIFYVIFTHAFITALFEEALFRFVPISLISPYSKRAAVLFSSLFFALAHCNLFQLPYAFFAGCVFSVIDIACDSILPSFIIHFLNNLISVFWQRYGTSPAFAKIYIIALVSLALISLVPLVLRRSEYKEKLASAFSGKGKADGYGIAPWIFTVMTFIIAITSLI